MLRPARIRLILSLLFAGFAFVSAARAAAPNFIVMVLDDMRLGDMDYMPNVQSLLVAQGMKFAEGFVVNGTCCPARAAILRGQYPHNSGVNRVGDGFKKYHGNGDEQDNLATRLHNAGYRTGLYGKYFVDYPAAQDKTFTPPGWDEWVAMGNKKGYYDYDLVENGVTVHYGLGIDDYVTDVLSGKVIGAIRRAQDDTRPFFLYVTPMAPHEPSTPAARHLTLFSDLKAPRPPSFNESSVSDKPLWVSQLPLLNASQKNSADATFRDRLRTLQAVDEMVAIMVDNLGALGLLDSTYILFTSDQGYMLGEHRIPYGKGNSYEEVIRVPFVIRGPGVSSGLANSNMVLHTDIMPTLLEAAGLPVPGYVDGRSLKTLFGGVTPKKWRSRFLVEHPLEPLIDVSFGAPPHHTIRTKRYLYTEYVYTAEREYYDLSSDVYEMTNKYTPAGGTVINGLAADLATLKTCAGASCVSAEDDATP